MDLEEYIYRHIMNHFIIHGLIDDYTINKFFRDLEFWTFRHDAKVDVFMVDLDRCEVKRIAQDLPKENLYLDEDNTVYTETEIYNNYMEYDAEEYEADGCDFRDYIVECTGKNGTLVQIYKA